MLTLKVFRRWHVIFTTIVFVIITFMCIGMVGCDSEDEILPMFIQANPTNGSTIQEDEDIIVTFDMPPEELSVTGGEFSLSDTSVTITGPFTPGTLNIILTWTGGAQALTYTVEPVKQDNGSDDPDKEILIEDLVIGNFYLHGIALDVAGGKMYWSYQPDNIDINEEIRLLFKVDKIRCANLDGSNVQDILTELIDPDEIKLDIAGGKMYWIEGRRQGIWRANLDGSNVQNLVRFEERFITGAEHPRGLALDVAGKKMYWTYAKREKEKIQRANLDGSNVQDLVTRGLESPGDITLDVVGGKMYWIDGQTDKIQRANLDGSNVQDILTGLKGPNEIALDIARKKIFWTEWDRYGIRCANFDGSNVQVLLTGWESAYDIALDIAGKKIYWSELDKIRRANLD